MSSTKHNMETTENNFTIRSDEPLNESLDACKVYNHATNLMPPSPDREIESPLNILKETQIKLSLASLYRSFRNDSNDSETKQWNQRNSEKTRSLNKYAPTYEVEKYDRNAMIIFNLCRMEDGDRRFGTERDEEALIRTFKTFKFEVTTHRDLRKRELLRTITSFGQSDFSDVGCICVAILTHGHHRPGFLRAYDTLYSEQEVLKAFDSSRNPTLVAKPIIFIIQACRGSEASVKVTPIRHTRRLQLDIDDDLEDYSLPLDADRIVFHSSAVGMASFRHTEKGSWFIQALCEKLDKCGRNYDLETIFKMVMREVALNYVSSGDLKQMPVVSSTLLRRLYLNGPGARLVALAEYKKSLSCEFHKQPEKPKEAIISTQQTDGTRDPSLSKLQPLHMPCSCFLEYFEYLKKCLEGFVDHNPEDRIANILLKMVNTVGSGPEHNLQKFDFIQTVWEHFDANMDKFPGESAKFIYRKYC